MTEGRSRGGVPVWESLKLEVSISYRSLPLIYGLMTCDHFLFLVLASIIVTNETPPLLD